MEQTHEHKTDEPFGRLGRVREEKTHMEGRKEGRKKVTESFHVW